MEVIFELLLTCLALPYILCIFAIDEVRRGGLIPSDKETIKWVWGTFFVTGIFVLIDGYVLVALLTFSWGELIAASIVRLILSAVILIAIIYLMFDEDIEEEAMRYSS